MTVSSNIYRRFLRLILAFVPGALSCVDKFNPPEITQIERYLVVDGFFNSGNDSSKVKLTRTQNLQETTESSMLETGATVMVEAKNGRQFLFQETEKGVYVIKPQQVDQYDTYRLRIKTKAGKTYLSNYMGITSSPEIDSISYHVLDNRQNVEVVLATHDKTTANRFYRWEFTETWEYNAVYRSGWEVINKGKPSAAVVLREDDIYTCWKSFKPTRLFLGSTALLSENVVRNLILTTVPVSSGKFTSRYSIFVKQFALSREEFEYWTALAKSTENTGSIFDPIPANGQGNMYAVGDSQEPVFGFFSVGKPSEKRFFISERLGFTPFCSAKDSLVLERDVVYTDSLIIEKIKEPGEEKPVFYRVISPECADCRMSGGTTRRPAFW